MPGLNSTAQPYVGLSNQGATCYMNSLLQTLFMTPEFCMRLYQWKYDSEKHQSKEDCIPYQLQLLFARLQLKENSYVDTNGLTKSFQWSIRESLQQHDVQEFCRVLFDAVEESVKGTEQAKMITELYEGTILDYVKCLQCNQESRKEDKFLDLSLTVKNEFEGLYNDSVEKAFTNYLKPEMLSGDNKYLCENCQARTDAVKGLKFLKLPYILVLQLKRFDLDYTTLQRKKLNDKVTFPQILNMNPYIVGELPENISSDDTESMELDKSDEEIEVIIPNNVDELDLNVKKTIIDECIASDREKYSTRPDYVAIEKRREYAALERVKNRERLVKLYLEQGEDVYELFSIMIHAGSALGGHYYAYIKSFDTQRWCNFNDTQVKEIDEKDIEKVYGGSNLSSWGGHYGANAYLLMYRKVNSSNINNPNQVEIPECLLQELKSENEQKIQEIRDREEKLMQLQLRIFYSGDEKTIVIRKDKTLNQLKIKAIAEFKLEHIRNEDIRLRNYNAQQDIYLNTYTGKETWTLDSLLILNHVSLVIEIKESHEVFVDYDQNSFSVKIYLHNPQLSDLNYLTFEQKYKNPYRLQLLKSAKLCDLMALIHNRYRIPPEKQLIWRKSGLKNVFILDEITTQQNIVKSLMSIRVHEGANLLLEEKTTEDVKWRQEMDKESYKIQLKFNKIGSAKYENQILLDKRELLKNLKRQISSFLTIHEDCFLIKRGSQHGHELKDLNVALNAAHLNNGSIVHIELGKPSNPGEIQIILSVSEVWNESDSESFKFWSLGDVKVLKDANISEIKNKICEYALSLYPSLTLSPATIRLRERNINHLLRVLTDHDLLSDFNHGLDKVHLSLQIDIDPENFDNSKLIILTRKFSPSTWELSKPLEVTINKKSRVDDIGKQIASIYGIPSNLLQMCIIPYVYTFIRGDLVDERWISTHGNFNLISLSPFFINKDGSLLIVKNSSEILREMTPDEKHKFTVKNYGLKPVISNSNSFKEKAVKITVKKSNNYTEK